MSALAAWGMDPVQNAYMFHEFLKMAAMPFNLAARAIEHSSPVPMIRANAAFLRSATDRHDKPAFNIPGMREEVIARAAFGDLLRFTHTDHQYRPKVLLVAPMSGHYASSMREVVAELAPDHDVYVTDWKCATQVPAHQGKFDLDDYISTLRGFMHKINGRVHLIGVSQSTVPVLALTALMAADHDPKQPKSAELIAGPIDTRINPTGINEFAIKKGLKGFTSVTLPPYKLGAGRDVHTGENQLVCLMSANPAHHVRAAQDFYQAAWYGDGEGKRRYDHANSHFKAVMALTAEFVRHTLEKVFLEHHLPRGIMRYRDQLVRPESIRNTALMTIEGSNDKIVGKDQCHRAHDLCTSLSADMRMAHTEDGAGHDDVYAGEQWKRIAVRVKDFIRKHDQEELRFAPVSAPGLNPAH